MENYKGTVIKTMQPKGILIYKDEANMQNKNACFSSELFWHDLYVYFNIDVFNIKSG